MNPVLHQILTQPQQTLDLRRLIDEGRILIVNLAKGKIGEDTAALLGSLLVASIGTSALSRADSRRTSAATFGCTLKSFTPSPL